MQISTIRKRSRRHPRIIFLASAIIVLTVIAGGAVASSAVPGFGRPEVTPGEFPSTKDDPNPPPPPPEKAAAAAAEVSHEIPEAHTHPDSSAPHPDDDPGLSRDDLVSDPDTWVCVMPDGGGYAVSIDKPTPEIEKAARQWIIDQRRDNPSFMPTVELPPAPKGCQPAEGEPSLEDWHRERSLLKLLNADGTLKDQP